MPTNGSFAPLSRLSIALQRYLWSAGRHGRAAARTGGRALDAVGPNGSGIFCYNAVAAVAAFHAALFVGSGFSGSAFSVSVSIGGGVFAMFAAVAVFSAFGLHRLPATTETPTALLSLAKAAAAQTVLLAATWSLVPPLPSASIGLFLTNWISLVVFLFMPHPIAKLFRRSPAVAFRSTRDDAWQGIPVLLVGAGDSAEAFIRDSKRDPGCLYRPVGLVDEMGPYLRSYVLGVEIVGRVTEIPVVVKRLASRNARPRMLVVTEDVLSPDTMRMLLDEATRAGLLLRRIRSAPGRSLAERRHVRLHPVSVGEFLDRRDVHRDFGALRDAVADMRVMITGAGGALGRALARQVIGLGPATVTLVDDDEARLYALQRDLGDGNSSSVWSVSLCNVADRDHVRNVFARHRPNLVFHVASMTHVPVAETNPCEVALRNVLGVRHVADSCVEFGVTAMLNVSTDAAGRPHNVLGRTYRVGESYCQLLDRRGEGTVNAPRIMSLRLPNVVGVEGSVIEHFERQLANGGPLTVSDPAAARSFVSVGFASASILEAMVIGVQEGDAAPVFVAERPSPTPIRDLATLMIRLNGLVPDRDIRVVYTGLPPGEDGQDGITQAGQTVRRFESAGIRQAAAQPLNNDRLIAGLEDLASAVKTHAEERVRNLLQELASEPEPVTQPQTLTGTQSPAFLTEATPH